MAHVDLIVFLRIEHAAERRTDAQHREVVAGHDLRFESFGPVVDADRHAHEPPAEDLGQGFGLLLEILVDGVQCILVPMLLPMFEPRWKSITSSSGALTGSLRSRTWSIRVKIAVLAPIPRASDRMATMAKSGLRRSPRSARRRSDAAFISCLDGP